MTKDNWNDEEVGRWLKSVPKPEDMRSREEVLSRLKDDPRLRNKQKPRTRKWIPAGVAAAALLAAGILIPSMMDGRSEMSLNDTAGQPSQDAEMATESNSQAADENIAMTDEGNPDGEADLFSSEMVTMGPVQSAVYPDHLEGLVPFRIGLVESANVIPVTFLIPHETIEADFGGATPGQVELYNRYAPQIDEEALGFDDYHPYDAIVGGAGGEVTLNLSGTHSYDMASASIGAFTESVQETFREEESVQVMDEDGAPAEFDQVGPLPEIPLAGEGAVYFAYEKRDGATVLAPDRHLGPADAAEAISLMKGRTNDFYEPVVPEEADFRVELPEDGEVMTIRFEKPFDFSAMEEQDAARMIDGMVLTAAEYNLRVRFENAVNPPGGYRLEEALPLPAGPNGMSMGTAN